MARNVFRITPRASQVIRAIEDHLQSELDQAVNEANQRGGRLPRVRAIFNAGDFRFVTLSDDVTTVVHVTELEIAQTLEDDREFFLLHQYYKGTIVLSRHRVQRPEEKDFVYYTTKSVDLEEV